MADRYTESRPRSVLTLEFAFLTVCFGAGIGLSPIGVQIGASILFVLFLILTIRAARSATIALRDGQIIGNGLLKTVRLDQHELNGVSVAKGTVGLYEREYLVFALVDGTSVEFKALNSKPGDENSPVRRAAKRIGEAIDLAS